MRLALPDRTEVLGRFSWKEAAPVLLAGAFFLFRAYGRPDADSTAGIPGFTLYVGFYGSQAQGRTIHSPKSCMPDRAGKRSTTGRPRSPRRWADLLRDSALHGRSDEALVRIVVPIQSTEAEAFEVAEQIAGEVIPAVDGVLPDL